MEWPYANRGPVEFVIATAKCGHAVEADSPGGAMSALHLALAESRPCRRCTTPADEMQRRVEDAMVAVLVDLWMGRRE